MHFLLVQAYQAAVLHQQTGHLASVVLDVYQGASWLAHIVLL